MKSWFLGDNLNIKCKKMKSEFDVMSMNMESLKEKQLDLEMNEHEQVLQIYDI